MFRTSMLAREESRIFEELLSRFDSLGDEQLLAVGVTPDGRPRICWRTWPAGNVRQRSKCERWMRERGHLKNGLERKSCGSIGKL